MDCIVIAKQTAYLKAFRLLGTFSPKLQHVIFFSNCCGIFFTISSENLTVDQDKASPLIIIMFTFNTLLLGNLLKEVKRNNMLITLELKNMSANFQNLPTLPR